MTVPERRRALLGLLADYDPADEAEQEYLARMRDLAESSPDPFARDSFTPGHFTAGAFVVHPAQPRLLLIHHGKLGRWLQPGGHVDPGDTGPRHAARREAGEETGITAIELLDPGLFDVDVHRFPAGPGGGHAHEHFDLRFLFRARHAAVAAGPEVGAVRWMSRAEIEELDADRSLLRPAVKALDDLS